MKKNAEKYRARKAEKGIVLIITLLVLVAMMLISVSIVRSMDTSVLAVGNLTFQQAASSALDSGMEQTIIALTQRVNTSSERRLLENDGAFAGYYATIQAGENNNGIPAVLQTRPNGGGGVMTFNDTTTNNTLSVVVERLCTNIGPAIDNNNCIITQVGGGAFGGEQNKAMEEELPGIAGFGARIAYRITVRADGVRNTTAFAQSLIYI